MKYVVDAGPVLTAFAVSPRDALSYVGLPEIVDGQRVKAHQATQPACVYQVETDGKLIVVLETTDIPRKRKKGRKA